jgi:hypothetical protein
MHPSDPNMPPEVLDRAEQTTGEPQEAGAGASPVGGAFNTRVLWWLAWSVLAALLSCLSLASPAGRGTDELSHMIKAAAAVRGEVFGKSIPDPGRYGNRPLSPWARYTLPPFFARMTHSGYCLWLSDARPASCLGPYPSARGRELPADSYHGHLEPAYYFLLGLPTLPFPDERGIYLARILNDLVSAAMLASALVGVAELRRGPLPLLATLACITPASLALAAVASPQGPGYAAAVALAVAAAGTVVAGASGRVLARAAVAGTLVVITRAEGPAVAAVIVTGVLVCLLDKGTARRLLGDRGLWATAAWLGAVSSFQLWWDAEYRAGRVLGVLVPNVSLASAFHVLYGLIPHFIAQQLAGYQYMTSAAAVGLWALLAGSVLYASLLLCSRRALAWAALMVAGWLAGPIALSLPSYKVNGPIWQGRYLLPLLPAVLVPVALSLDAARGPLRERIHDLLASRKALAAWLSLALLGYLLFFYEVVRMYAVGLKGKLVLVPPFPWQPPESVYGALAGLASFSAALCALAAYLVTAGGPGNEPVGGRGAAPQGRPRNLAETTVERLSSS